MLLTTQIELLQERVAQLEDLVQRLTKLNDELCELLKPKRKVQREFDYPPRNVRSLSRRR